VKEDINIRKLSSSIKDVAAAGSNHCVSRCSHSGEVLLPLHQQRKYAHLAGNDNSILIWVLVVGENSYGL